MERKEITKSWERLGRIWRDAIADAVASLLYSRQATDVFYGVFAASLSTRQAKTPDSIGSIFAVSIELGSGAQPLIRLEYNPAMAEAFGLDVEEPDKASILEVLKHEIQHVVRLHLSRLPQEAKYDRAFANLANVVYDLYVNTDLVQSEEISPTGIIVSKGITLDTFNKMFNTDFVLDDVRSTYSEENMYCRLKQLAASRKEAGKGQGAPSGGGGTDSASDGGGTDSASNGGGTNGTGATPSGGGGTDSASNGGGTNGTGAPSSGGGGTDPASDGGGTDSSGSGGGGKNLSSAKGRGGKSLTGSQVWEQLTGTKTDEGEMFADVGKIVDADGNPVNLDDLSDVQKKALKARIKELAKSAAKQAGTMPVGIDMEVLETKTIRSIASILKRGFSSVKVHGVKTLSPTRLGRRGYGYGKTRRMGPRVLVCVDTSGSMGDSPSVIVNSIRSVLEHSEVHWLTYDVGVYGPVQLVGRPPKTYKGGGGTSVEEVFTHLAPLEDGAYITSFDVVCIVSDFYDSMSTTESPFGRASVVFVKTENGDMSPKFGRVIDIASAVADAMK